MPSSPCPRGCECGKHSPSPRQYKMYRLHKFRTQIKKPGTLAHTRGVGRKAMGPRPCWCFCGHHSDEHSNGHSDHCKVFGCDCKKLVATSRYLLEQQDKIKRCGFTNHLGQNATCIACLDVVSIGHWHDPNVIRRALIHARQTCKRTNLVNRSTG